MVHGNMAFRKCTCLWRSNIIEVRKVLASLVLNLICLPGKNISGEKECLVKTPFRIYLLISIKQLLMPERKYLVTSKNQNNIYLLRLNYIWVIYVIAQLPIRMQFLMFILFCADITGGTEHLFWQEILT
ncbi:hypothetical protein SDC9_141297 [bioreactor metagenome]|uniref:Uncharacterized protein n=1 Tax=bioreactor metagenome TaxID=1076179 RepID=A0A645DZV9_9ZZZZ